MFEMTPHTIGQLSMALSISSISRMVSLRAAITNWQVHEVVEG